MKIKKLTAIVMVLIMCLTLSIPSEAATKKSRTSLKGKFNYTTVNNPNRTIQKTVEIVKTPKASDWRYMTCIIYCEARGESYQSQKAVGIVVMNRVKSDLFPNNIYDVIYQRGQFSPTRNGSMNRALNLYDQQIKTGKFSAEMTSCRKAAFEVLNGMRTIEVNGKTHDMSSYLFFSNYIRGARFILGKIQFK